MVALSVLIALVAVPIAEIMVLIEVGGMIGTVETIGLVLLTAIGGAFLIRYQGLTVLATLRRDLDRGLSPIGAVVDGAFLLVAGGLLLTPGFLTDSLGFALLVPGLRRMIARAIILWIAASGKPRTVSRGRRGSGNAADEPSDGPVIDGTFSEVEPPPSSQPSAGSPWHDRENRRSDNDPKGRLGP